MWSFSASGIFVTYCFYTANITIASVLISPLNKDAPFSRAVQTVGRIAAEPVLGGLHHYYARI
jgi:hypothetical protein